MKQSLAAQWQSAFWQTAQRIEYASVLRDAALRSNLGDWTKALTAVAVTTCRALGWQASAKDHHLDMLPIPHYEYLTLDVVAFAESEKRWRFPVAAIELENSPDNDRIAYSLWKVLCVRSELRVVFCYRRTADEGAALMRFLRDDVIHAMHLEDRLNLGASTIVVIGSRDDAATFPYGFFKWWQLDPNVGSFHRCS